MYDNHLKVYEAIKWSSNEVIIRLALVIFGGTIYFESAKLRALSVKNVLTCQGALRAYVLKCQRALCAYVLTCQRALRAYVLMFQRVLRARVLTCQRALRTHVLTCQRALRTYMLTCQRASFDATIFSFAAIVAEVVHTVGKV